MKANTKGQNNKEKNQKYRNKMFIMKNNNYFMFTENLRNLKKLHENAKSGQKSTILSTVAYDEMKLKLKKYGFKFSDKQFKLAKQKRLNNNLCMNNYKRYQADSKKELTYNEKENIIQLLLDNSKESSSEKNTRILNFQKKVIYYKYIEDINNKRASTSNFITYNTFLKYIPKYFKKGKRKTDVCGICELGKSLKNIDKNILSNEQKKEVIRNENILKNHIQCVDNQKLQFNLIRNNLDNETCLLIMDFKENFRLSYGGNEIGNDYYNKRQISCLGVSLIYNIDGNEYIQYISYLSKILSHDSLFSSDVLEQFLDELNSKYKNIHIFTDCGPHFRSKEFICRVKNISKKRNKNVSLHFFAEYHGKSLVDGHFGRLSQLFKKNIDINYYIENVQVLRDVFEKEAKLLYNEMYFRIYDRDSRVNMINKIRMTKFKLYLSYYFIDGVCFYSPLTRDIRLYTQLDANDTKEIDKRITKLTPNGSIKLRSNKLFNKRTYELYKDRIS